MARSNNQNLEMLDIVTLISFAMQAMNYAENQHQSNNDDIMAELQRQDRQYLNKILENQNKILHILSEIKPDMSAENQ
jgi:hypothetical protein